MPKPLMPRYIAHGSTEVLRAHYLPEWDGGRHEYGIALIEILGQGGRFSFALGAGDVLRLRDWLNAIPGMELFTAEDGGA